MSQRVSFQVLLGQTGDVFLSAGETLDDAAQLKMGAFLPTFVFLAVILHLDLQGQQGAVRAEQTFYLDGIAGLGVTLYLGIGCDGHSLPPACQVATPVRCTVYQATVQVSPFNPSMVPQISTLGSPDPLSLFTSSSTKRF